MDRKPVKSSNIKSVGYDAATRKMHVEFSSGGVYEYDGVEPSDHNSFVHDRSPGKHFQEYIRNNKRFTAKKL